MSNFGRGVTVRARKNHFCEWCWSAILMGEEHYRFKGKWEGEFQDWRMHRDCRVAFEEESEGGEIHDHRHDQGRTCLGMEFRRKELIAQISYLLSKRLPVAAQDIRSTVVGVLELLDDQKEREFLRLYNMRRNAMEGSLKACLAWKKAK